LAKGHRFNENNSQYNALTLLALNWLGFWLHWLN